MEAARTRREDFSVVIVGGGQAGLAAAYYLSRAGLRYVVVEANSRVGDSWRKRWSSLRLFTPARIDALPGMRFPLRSNELPTKDAMADYLESYASRFELPVRLGVRVESLEARDGSYFLRTSDGDLQASQIIVATGAHQKPRIPNFASQLDSQIKQLDPTNYAQPSQLQTGGVLVAGAGNSGAEIALEAAAEHRTWLSGRSTGAGNPRVFTRPLWWMGLHIMTRATPVGRRLSRQMSGVGAPILRIKPEDLAAHGIERVPRTTGVVDGKPQLEDGRVLDVSTVVWCTGFAADFAWIHVPVFDEAGRPIHERGVVRSQPGLYFLGLPFLYGVTSALVGGIGRDARFLASQVVRSTQLERAAAGAHQPTDASVARL